MSKVSDSPIIIPFPANNELIKFSVTDDDGNKKVVYTSLLKNEDELDRVLLHVNNFYNSIGEADWNNTDKALDLFRDTVEDKKKIQWNQVVNVIAAPQTIQETLREFVTRYSIEDDRKDLLRYLTGTIKKPFKMTVRAFDGQFTTAHQLLGWLEGKDPPEPTEATRNENFSTPCPAHGRITSTAPQVFS